MKKKEFLFLVFFAGTLFLTGCDSSGTSDTGSLKSAEPYPVQSIDTSYTSTDVKTFTDPEGYLKHVILLFGDDTSVWPESALNAYLWFTTGGSSSYPNIEVTANTYQKVNDVIFFEYCSWYQPDTTLSISLSTVNETSVSTSITTSVGASIGYDSTSINASISKQTTETVTTAAGIEVSTSYDLTQYDQDKVYKAVLVGSYTCIRYTFKTGPRSWEETGIDVDQNSLTVKLVYDTQL